MATLVVVNGPAAGQKFALGAHRLVMLGRDAEATFQIIDDRVSRTHVQLKRLPGDAGHAAIDYGSANGVFVNDARIDAETPLRDHDVIRIGESSIVYTTSDDPDAKTIAQVWKQRSAGQHGTITDRSRQQRQ